jgi:hypothetical protein
MSGFRLTPEIIDAVLSLGLSPPADGQLPKQETIPVPVGGATINVPVVVARAFIAGSGPIAYAQAFIYVSSPEYLRCYHYQMLFR